MNLSAENMQRIRNLVQTGSPLSRADIQDLNGHNEHLTLLLEARFRLMLGLETERDQLRAEAAGLKTGYEAYEQTVKELRAEVEALRKERDARHPFKPFHEPSIGFTGCVICGVYTDHGGLPCPRTRATADAAMGQGEQS